MEKMQQSVITLVKSALTGISYPLPEDFDLEKVINYAKESQTVNMLYYGLINCKVSPDSSLMKRLFMTACAAISVDGQQLYEFSRITKVFDENNVKYMPMKGVLLKEIYPKSDMRTMSDLDILIDETQYGIIEPIMEQLGYQKGEESDHELPWGKDKVYVELHKRMISTHNKDFYAYFGDGWSFSHPAADKPNRYEMNHEDMYIYLFSHMAKHYRSGGIGIKHFTDLWVYKNHYNKMNIEYIESALMKMKLKDFYDNVMLTLKVWFEDVQSTEITDLITNVVFKSGGFGDHEDHLASLVIRDSKTENKKQSRIKKILMLFFPPYSKMCAKYSILRKYPVLLPVMWIYRGLASLKYGGGKLRSVGENVNIIANNKVELYHQSLQKVGLDFNFEEHLK